MDVDKAIGEHYGRPGLEESILAALADAGRDPERIRPEDIADIDELHVGGATTVRQLAHDVGLTSHARILDIGSGLGGPARQYAREFGATVDGIDVTPRFVTTAASLTRRSGITAGVTFTLGSALDLPYEDAVFDAATMIHVGMNIEDKSTLFRGVARVLKPGARFAIFDFMVVGDGKMEYPLPWADTVDTSFLATPDDYLSLLGDAGFAIDKQESRQQAASEGPVSRASSGNEGPPPVLGLQLVLGENVATRMANISAARSRGVLAPIEIVSHIERPA